MLLGLDHGGKTGRWSETDWADSCRFSHVSYKQVPTKGGWGQAPLRNNRQLAVDDRQLSCQASVYSRLDSMIEPPLRAAWDVDDMRLSVGGLLTFHGGMLACLMCRCATGAGERLRTKG